MGIVWLYACTALPMLLPIGSQPPDVDGKDDSHAVATADDRIDYLKLLNDRLSGGVTTENNSAIAVLLSMSDADLPEWKGWRAEALSRLGVKDDPEHPKFVRIEEVLEEDETSTEADAELDRALASPWSKEECPIVTRWIERNAEVLVQIEAKMFRSHFYVPILVDPEDNPPLAYFAALPHIGFVYGVGKAITARGYGHVHAADPERAANDVIFLKRLARNVACEKMLLSQLVAYSTDARATRLLEAVLSSRGVTVNEIRSLQASFSDLHDLPDIGDAIDVAERSFLLDIAQVDVRLWLPELLGSPFFPLPRDAAIDAERADEIVIDFIADHLDSEAFARQINNTFDEFIEVISTHDYKLSAETLWAWKDRSRPALQELVRHLLTRPDGEPTPETRELAGLVVLDLFVPALAPAVRSSWMINVNHDLESVAFVLAIYRIENGHYPDSIDSLVPEHLDAAPQDRFSGQPILYRRLDDGSVRIWSVGSDGKDDGGDPVKDVAMTLK